MNILWKKYIFGTLAFQNRTLDNPKPEHSKISRTSRIRTFQNLGIPKRISDIPEPIRSGTRNTRIWNTDIQEHRHSGTQTFQNSTFNTDSSYYSLGLRDDIDCFFLPMMKSTIWILV